MIRAVVFDLGQVLAYPTTLYADSAEMLGVSASDYEAMYWKERPAYDAGASDTVYWGSLLRMLGLEDRDEAVEAISRFDATQWTRIRPAAHQLLRDCRAAGRTVAVLSNAPVMLHSVAEETPWRKDVDHLFVSGPMGVAKPHPEIYLTAQQELGVEGNEIAFIDDRQPNVDGALAVGWQAHLWVDDADTRAWLESLDVL